MKHKKLLLIGLLIISLTCIFTTLTHQVRTDASDAHADIGLDLASQWAEERAKVIDEKWGPDAYGGTADLHQKEEAERKRKEDPSYAEGYDYGHEIGYEYGFVQGRSEGYRKGYKDGYDVGYKTRSEETTFERKTETKTALLLFSILAISIILLFLKFIKRH